MRNFGKKQENLCSSVHILYIVVQVKLCSLLILSFIFLFQVYHVDQKFLCLPRNSAHLQLLKGTIFVSLLFRVHPSHCHPPHNH